MVKLRPAWESFRPSRTSPTRSVIRCWCSICPVCITFCFVVLKFTAAQSYWESCDQASIYDLLFSVSCVGPHTEPILTLGLLPPCFSIVVVIFAIQRTASHVTAAHCTGSLTNVRLSWHWYFRGWALQGCCISICTLVRPLSTSELVEWRLRWDSSSTVPCSNSWLWTKLLYTLDLPLRDKNLIFWDFISSLHA